MSEVYIISYLGSTLYLGVVLVGLSLDTGGTLIFYFFLVSILNNYLFIFYLLFWILLLVCILIF